MFINLLFPVSVWYGTKCLNILKSTIKCYCVSFAPYIPPLDTLFRPLLFVRLDICNTLSPSVSP